MNTIFEDNYLLAIETLKSQSKKHTSLKRSFINELNDFLKYMLEKKKESFPLVNNKLILNIKFYSEFCSKIAINTQDNIKNENEYYKNFLRLKKFGLIHIKSSNFPKALTLISINPNPNYFLSNAYEFLDDFIIEKQQLINKMQEEYDLLENLYIYLRLYTNKMLGRRELSLLDFKNTIYINNNMIIQFMERIDLFGYESYNLYCFDNIASIIINKFLNRTCTENFFNNINYYEQKYNKYKTKVFKNLHFNQLKELNLLIHTYESSSIECMIVADRIATVKLTITDIINVYPEVSIPKHILDIENKLLKISYNKYYEMEDENDVIGIKEKEDQENAKFYIKDIDSILTLLRINESYISNKLYHEIKNELEYIKKTEKSDHINMILDYLLYLVDFLHNKILRTSTVKNYIGILNKHIFSKIKDLTNIEQSEYEYISYILNYSNYKPQTIKSYLKIIARFFKYHKSKGIEINYSSFIYPKSLVLKEELQIILNEIEKNYISRNKIIRISKYDKFDILQHQIMVLLSFYTGMRKSELRTRLVEDLFVSDDISYINVNNKGLRKIKLKLKTSTSKRRIPIIIDNEFKHYFTKWNDDRKKILQKNVYLFIERATNSFSSKTLISETSINSISEIIKDVTKRYCTFHSLRHSYITYQLINILNSENSNPYLILDLCIKAGHSTPAISLSSYAHYYFIRLYNRKDTV